MTVTEFTHVITTPPERIDFSQLTQIAPGHFVASFPEVERSLIVDDRLPIGKGVYIWNYPKIGTPEEVRDGLLELGMRHAIVKIADGSASFPPASMYDLGALVKLLKAAGIQVWGYQYVRGLNPAVEAKKGYDRMVEYALFGMVWDAESEFRPNKWAAARSYTNVFFVLAPTMPVALSSNRYPLTSWTDFPWGAFREAIDFDMPQVYWLGAHNPGFQLRKSYNEFKSMAPFLPYIPTGSTWKQADWECTPADVIEFMDTARELGLQAVNFWEYSRLLDLPHVWEAIANYDYGAGLPIPEPIPDDEGEEMSKQDVLSHIDRIVDDLGLLYNEVEALPEGGTTPPPEPEPEPEPEPSADTWEMEVRPEDKDDTRTKAFTFQVWNENRKELVDKLNASGKFIMQDYFSIGGARLTYNRGVKVRVYKEIIDAEADGSIDYYELYAPMGDRGQRLFLLKADLMKLV